MSPLERNKASAGAKSLRHPPEADGEASSQGGRYRTRALLRGLSLLACFNPEAPELSLAECAQRANLDKATALRLLTCLVEAGFLIREAERGLYRVGTAVLPIASAFQEGQALVAIAGGLLRELAARTGQTATLAIRDGAWAVNVFVASSDRPLRRFAYVGERFPLHSTSVGKAIAAHLLPSVLHSLLGEGELARFTSHTITTASALAEELDRIRRSGYALDDEEAIEGVRCVGAAVRDYSGNPVAAISVAGATGEFTGEALEHWIHTVITTASEISARLGFMGAVSGST